MNAENTLKHSKANLIGEVKLSYHPEIKSSDLPIVTDSNSASKILREKWSDDICYREEVNVLLLNTSCRLIGFAPLFKGGINSTIADTRVILQLALLSNASSIIIAHNHPSGNKEPSDVDINMTYQLIKALNVFNISL